MPGPSTEAEAVVWIQGALQRRLYIIDSHLFKRGRERRFSIHDAKKIIVTATSCVPYLDRTPSADGTCWRLTGTALDGTAAKLGVEAFRDHLGQQIILVTIMDG
jgi:hypothetical protein